MLASNLRQRQAKLDKSMARQRERDLKDTSGDERVGVPKPRKVTSTPIIRGRTHALLSALGIAIFLLIYKRNSTHRLPPTYAVCSKVNSSQIYTVDDASPTVECVVISNSFVADAGTLDYVRHRWGDAGVTGPGTLSSGGGPSPKAGVKIKYLESGQAMYPGFADAHAHILGYGNYKQLPLLGSASASGMALFL